LKKRILGRTGLEVGELALGAAFITGGEAGYSGASLVVWRALELGMNLADTSADYGDSEKALGHALHEIGKPCIVSTKLGPRPGQPFNPKDKACLRRIFEESLEFLHREVIDILMIHEPDRPGEFNNAIVRGRVQRAVEAELSSKGFRQADDAASPDFLVNYYPIWEPGRSQQVHMGLGFGMGPVGMGFAAPVGDPHREARAGLVLEFQDGRTRTVVWKATAPDALQGSDSPQEADANVKDAIHAMLNHFPPPGK